VSSPGGPTCASPRATDLRSEDDADAMWTRSGRPGAGVVVGDGDAVTDGRAL
jgi:hypothetical protein